MTELEQILLEIQDYLVPTLDTYEQAIYRYIFRHTYLIGEREMYFSTRSAEIGFGFGSGNNTAKPSMKTRSSKIRSLESKGAVRILERSNKGILVHINLPNEINGLITKTVKSEIDIDELDFYKDKRLLPALLERENGRCFYTGRVIDESSCYLDHVIPQKEGGDNSYKNIVATCFDANSMKNDKNVEDFLRELYQEGILSMSEFKEVKDKVSRLLKGEIVPDSAMISELYKEVNLEK